MLLVACGAPSLANTTTTGETDAVEAGVDAGSEEEDDDGIATDDDGVQCESEIAALIPLVAESEGGCSVLVRVHHETLTILGYQPTCTELPDEALDEAQARTLTECCASAGTAVETPVDMDPWVFHAEPEGDALGHAAIVSSHVGELVFEATIGRGETPGDITFPEAWAEAQGLGESCGATPELELSSYDLVEGGAVDDERLREVWSVVGSTALPIAMGVAGELQRVVVLRYPRTVSDFDASTAEYMVVLESGRDQT
jgi:hypothetical protein